MIRKLRRERILAEINITPFTDVILVLLIIFMIATPLLLQSSIRIKLPKASTAQPVENPQTVSITITNEGLVYLNATMVTKKELKSKIIALHKENPELNTFLRIDKSVSFQEIVDVLDILRELEVKNLDIAMTPKS